METKKGRFAEIAYVLGMILCPLGVCLSAKSGFGVSMVVAPAYVLYLRISASPRAPPASKAAADRAGRCCAAL